MRALATIIALLALALSAAPAGAASPSEGNFGVRGFQVSFEPNEGEAPLQAGAHPFALTATLGFNTDEAGGAGKPEGRLRDLSIEQVAGLLGDTTAYEPCTSLQFLLDEPGSEQPSCPLQSAVGITANAVTAPGEWATSPVYNLQPPPGKLLRLGFAVLGQRLVIDVGLSDSYPYAALAASRNVPQALDVYANVTRLWGDPSDPAHDSLRGPCGANINAASLDPADLDFPFEGGGKACKVAPNPKPFLTLPTRCGPVLRSSYEVLSWEGERDAGSAQTPDPDTGEPSGFRGCGALAAFDPEIGAAPTSRAAESPTGLDFSLGISDPGLTSTGGRAKSAIRKAVVTLPEGMTANPSLAEGLEVCSEADLRRERLGSAPGAGCPEASKIGAIEVDSPLVSETISGSLYQAAPYANLAEDALLAFYIVLRNEDLGIIVKQTAKVEPDSRSGRLVAITDKIPQLAFSEFRLRFREGARSPLITPPRCGAHAVSAKLTPWSGQAPIAARSSFEILSGPGGGPCPSGPLPFEPGFAAGSLNNAAGAFSPFAMRLTRRDGDQDLTRFDAVLPRGVAARIAGVPWCPDAAIAAAKQKTGKAELAAPSCPPASQIGRVLSGAGVGSQLTYVPGALYLAGPFGAAPLSVVAVVPAVAGPFDVGTVVVRQALGLDPVSGEVSADGALSDPLPHILAGIPLRVRDIQVFVDRPGFTLNPTSCAPMATLAGIWGGGSRLFSTADDRPVLRQAPYQAASCAALGFGPRLGLRLRGGTRRGAFPALRATYVPRPGHANLKRLSLRFPRSAFIEQGHFRTICTRVQFAAGPGHGALCPKGSVYGRARAFSPLLDEPLEGPVYLRSSDNDLPDAVFALKGVVDVEVAVRIDSARGGLRATVTRAPDLPVSRVVVNMRGGNKGLFVNSRNLCGQRNRATARLAAHNAKRAVLRPLVRPRCKQGRKGGRGRRARVYRARALR